MRYTISLLVGITHMYARAHNSRDILALAILGSASSHMEMPVNGLATGWNPVKR